MWGYDDQDDRSPTGDELLRWEADSLGERDPEAEWVLTNYDVWMRNPHYKGVKTAGHPEDHEPDDSCIGHRCDDGYFKPYVDETSPMQWDPGWEDLGDDDLPF